VAVVPRGGEVGVQKRGATTGLVNGGCDVVKEWVVRRGGGAGGAAVWRSGAGVPRDRERGGAELRRTGSCAAGLGEWGLRRFGGAG
jgi:hypothetical protein